MLEEQVEQKLPTKDELIAFLSEQIEVKSKQLDLQELNTKIAVARAEELKALSFIANITSPSTTAPQGDPHILTQDDIDEHPELSEAGLKVGDEVMVGKQEEQPKKRTLKK